MFCMEKKIRCFIALDLPDEAIKECERVQNEIKELGLFKGKFTKPGHLHLTLKFLGEISEEKLQQVKTHLKKINFTPFEAHLFEAGVFTPKMIRIIWLQLAGKGVYQLQKDIDNALAPLFSKEQRFMSHVTIARVKDIENKKALLDKLDNTPINKVAFQVKGFSLKKSTLTAEGPIYEVLDTYTCNL